MIQAIGFMIGFFFIARLVAQIEQGEKGSFSRVAGWLGIVIMALLIAALFSAGA